MAKCLKDHFLGLLFLIFFTSPKKIDDGAEKDDFTIFWVTEQSPSLILTETIQRGCPEKGEVEFVSVGILPLKSFTCILMYTHKYIQYQYIHTAQCE